MRFFTGLFSTLKQLVHLHKYAWDILCGSLQFTAVVYAFAGVVYAAAPYTGDYMRSISYYQAALEIAPVTLAAGIVSALLCDLILRKTKPDGKPSDRDKK